MKKIFTLCLAILALGAFKMAHDGIHELEIGDAAKGTDIKLENTEGKKVTLGDLKGKKGLLVIFSCNTCPWVMKWEGRYNGLAETCKKNDIGMVVVNSNAAKREGDDSMESIKAHAKKSGYTFPYVMDEGSALADALGATRTPHVFLFDADLKLAYRGAIDDNADDVKEVKTPWLQNALSNLAAGKAIYPNSTKSLGCTIKRIPQ